MTLDGDTAVFSSSGHRADIFDWQQGQWVFAKSVSAEVIPEDGVAPVVEIDGDILLLSEPDHDETDGCSWDGNCGDTGLVYVFERNLGGTNNWGLRATLNGGHKPGANFGRDIQIDGDTVVVSAAAEEEGTVSIQSGNSVQNTENSGAYTFYERNEGGVDLWGLKHR